MSEAEYIRIKPSPEMRAAIAEAIGIANSTPPIGYQRPCPDCGRPQHYTGTEHGWAHDALVDTWHCADPRKAGA